MKILVSGGSGFLGSKVVQALLKNGHEITILIRENKKISNHESLNVSYLKYSEVHKEKKLNEYEAIFYCATKYSYEKGKAIDLIDANLIIPLDLLKVGVKNKIKFFINVDTIIDENLNDYSISKSNLRYWIRKLDGAINVVNIRLDHFFGPGDKSFKFVNSMIISLLNNQKSISLTKGEQKRAFIYIDDVISAIGLIIENLDKKINYQEYNISGKQSYTIKNIVEKIKKLTNNNKTQLLWGKLPYRENEIFNTKSDLVKIKSIGWEQDTDIDSGLRKTIKYYLK